FALQLLFLLLVEHGFIQQLFQLFVDMLIGKLQLRNAILIVERHRSPVLNGLLKIIGAHVIPEHLARFLILPFNQRRAGKAQESRVGQGFTHIHGQLVVLGAMGLVGDDNNIIIGAQDRKLLVVATVKFMDERKYIAM